MIFVAGVKGFRTAIEEAGSGLGGRFSRVDYSHPRGNGLLNKRPQKGVVRAAKYKRVRLESVGFGVTRDLSEVNAEDFIGHGMGCPAFFNKRDEQRAGFFNCSKALSIAGSGICVALDGGIRGDDEYISG